MPYFAVVGLPEWLAYRLMPVIGSVDVALGLLVALRPVRAVLLYMAVLGPLDRGGPRPGRRAPLGVPRAGAELGRAAGLPLPARLRRARPGSARVIASIRTPSGRRSGRGLPAGGLPGERRRPRGWSGLLRVATAPLWSATAGSARRWPSRPGSLPWPSASGRVAHGPALSQWSAGSRSRSGCSCWLADPGLLLFVVIWKVGTGRSGRWPASRSGSSSSAVELHRPARAALPASAGRPRSPGTARGRTARPAERTRPRRRRRSDRHPGHRVRKGVGPCT